jgi:fructokinase
MDTRVLVVGEVLIDVVRTPDGSVTEHVGGSPANVATGLARLGHPTDFATTVGTDDHGNACLDHMQTRGVVTLPSSRTAEPTSVADATIDDSGAATYRFDLHWNLAPVPIRSDVGHVHTGSIAATQAPGAARVLTTLREAHDRATISYDPNARPSIMGEPESVKPVMEGIIALSDVVKASEDDIAWLYPGRRLDDVLDDWHALGAALVLVTLGPEGVAFRVPATGEVIRYAAQVTDNAAVVDTVGAGDSFMAGLVSGLLDAGLLGSPATREADETPWRLLTTEGVAVVEGPDGRHLPVRCARGTAAARRDRHARHRALPAPGPPRPVAHDPRGPRGQQQRQVRRPRPAQERQHRRRRRPADVPGHRHGHRHGQTRSARADRGARRGRCPGASSTPTPGSTCATARWRR